MTLDIIRNLFPIRDSTIAFSEDSKNEGLLAPTIEKIIKAELSNFTQEVSITNKNEIPDTTQIPIQKPTYWFKIPNVICCFVDMEGSTQLSAGSHDKTTAKAYRLFTETAIRNFHEFGAAYIDVKGDGVFSLFNNNKHYTALQQQSHSKHLLLNTLHPRLKV